MVFLALLLMLVVHDHAHACAHLHALNAQPEIGGSASDLTFRNGCERMVSVRHFWRMRPPVSMHIFIWWLCC